MHLLSHLTVAYKTFKKTNTKKRFFFLFSDPMRLYHWQGRVQIQDQTLSRHYFLLQ
jgi:hypothetical protein